jgi:hypothetical protein
LLSCSSYPVLAVLSWLSCPVVLTWLLPDKYRRNNSVWTGLPEQDRKDKSARSRNGWLRQNNRNRITVASHPGQEDILGRTAGTVLSGQITLDRIEMQVGYNKDWTAGKELLGRKTVAEQPRQDVLSRTSYPGRPIQTVLSWLSCFGCPIPVLSMLLLAILSSFLVLAVLS